ncbi:MAG: hypothetical protein ACXWK8_01580 [Myxococcaceae bacterium]
MRLLASSLLAFALAGCASTSAGGKPASTGSVPVETIAPRPEDVGSVDGLMRAFYEVTNVAPDAPRQWARDRTLYVPWIRFVALGPGASGRPAVTVWTHQEFVDATEPLIQKGFVEREIFRTTRRYGNMVHVDSTYEALVGVEQPRRIRGVNSIELYFDGQRWWVASVVWQSEDAAHPIPPELLPPALR